MSVIPDVLDQEKMAEATTAQGHPTDGQAAAAPPPKPVNAKPSRLMNAVVILGMVGFIGFGLYKLLPLLGVNVQGLLSPAPQPITLNRVQQQANVAPQPVQAVAATAAQAINNPMRDQPPVITANKPNFAIRDGVEHSFITDLDNQTLKRLDQLDGTVSQIVGYTDQMGQAVKAMAGGLYERMSAVEQQQQSLQATFEQTNQLLANLRLEIGDLRATVTRYRGDMPAALPKGKRVSGWSVNAVNGDRAWLKTQSGKVVTVISGDRLKQLGAVNRVDSRRKLVVLSDGRYIQ